MAIDLYWASGSPYSWRVLLALEHKGLSYNSHLLQLSKQEQISPQMLRMNPRGRLPVLKDGDYVVFESVAVLYYLDLKYPRKPIFGHTPEEAAVIMRVISEFQAYTEAHLMGICITFLGGNSKLSADALIESMHFVAREARTIEQRLSKSDWIVGANYSAADIVIFSAIQILRHALGQSDAEDLARRFMPIEINYPALGRWLKRLEGLPCYRALPF